MLYENQKDCMFLDLQGDFAWAIHRTHSILARRRRKKKITQNHLVPKMMPTGSKIALPHVINLEKMYNNNMKNMTLKNVYSWRNFRILSTVVTTIFNFEVVVFVVAIFWISIIISWGDNCSWLKQIIVISGRCLGLCLRARL